MKRAMLNAAAALVVLVGAGLLSRQASATVPPPTEKCCFDAKTGKGCCGDTWCSIGPWGCNGGIQEM
jgi:uncharacterized low-complexity protein